MALWDFLKSNAPSIISGGLNYFAGRNANKGNTSAGNQFYNQAQYKPYNINTAFGTSLFSGNSAVAGLSPRYQEIADQQRSFGTGLFNQLGDGSLDGLRDDQLSLLRQLSSPYETQRQNELDQRLFNRGQMGSTSGALQSRAFNDSLNTADLQRQLSAIGLAQTERKSLFDMANTALNNDLNINALPIQQLALGGQLGSQQSAANATAGGPQFDAITSGNANELQFWQNLAGGIGDFSNGAGVASDLGSLFNAGGGNPLSAISLTGKETLGGTGSWADLGTGPRQAGSLFSSGGAGNTLSGSAAAAEMAAAAGSLPAWYTSGATAAQTFGGAYTTALGGQAAAGAGGASTGASAATTGAGTAAMSFGIAAAMIPFLKALSNIKGGASESAKLGKMQAEIQKQIGIDPSGQSAMAFIDKIVNNQQWANESNGDELGTLFEAGMISLENLPSLSGSASRYDLWSSSPDTILKQGFGPAGVAASYGLPPDQQKQYADLSRKMASIIDGFKVGGDEREIIIQGEDHRGETRTEHVTKDQISTMPPNTMVLIENARGDTQWTPLSSVPGYSSAKSALDAFKPLMTEANKKAYASKVYNKFRSGGFTGDLSKLEKYLGIK